MVTRYDPTLSSDPYQSHEYAVMEEEATGEYVKHDDYEVLEKRIAELEKTCKSRSDTIIEYSNKIAKLEVKLTSANNIIKIMYMGEDDE